MKNLFEEIAEHFRRDHHDLSDDVVQGFLRALERARIEEMPCSEVFARLDEYVDRVVRGEGAARLMPLLREHLESCRDCGEEYEALLRMIEESAGRSTGAQTTQPARRA